MATKKTTSTKPTPVEPNLTTMLTKVPSGMLQAKMVTITIPVDKITYGADKNNVDLTTKMLPLFKKNTTYYLEVSNLLVASDPAVGKVKQLTFHLHNGTCIDVPERTSCFITLNY